MNDRDDIIEDRAASNMEEFMEHGPGLRTTTRSWVLQRCPKGHSLLGGLGGMGVGQMWFSDTYSSGRVAIHTKDETYVEAPIDGTGCTVCHPIDYSKVWDG